MADRRRRAGALLGAVTVLAAACGGGIDHDATVTLVDYAIGVPSTLEAGTNDLLVDVKGVAHHTLVVCEGTSEDGCEGDPVPLRVTEKPADARDPDLVPEETRALVLGAGWQASIAVDLEPGTYRFWCGIINHAQLGMDRTVEVVG